MWDRGKDCEGIRSIFCPPRLTRIDKSTLNALCKALKCQPGDLMRYEEDT
ncbi:MAG: helix-turn-helix transcriptional regulator [Pegethrix bostrychoides GSE-TBD4-15B]|uniref:Helix-turn-helix transcriptional regulator n=1 Tax=Pegethrix bostrychoides GSE-TBD4-15B TaxID=2839662 RepID=A0A951PDF4_9CYAN|nr:helix-turn-helix transcriptional regulator [Pegethrix bostrychoides GSE-TBD4-15B]